MIAGTHVTGSGAGGGGPPPPPPPPGGEVVCDDCGNCSFSMNSYLMVQKFIPSCEPFLLTEQDEIWPWFSASPSLVRWQLDAANWAEYSCVTNTWSWEAAGLDLSLVSCVQNTTPGYFFFTSTPCQGFEWRKKVSGAGSDETFLIAKLVNNVCTPSVPI